MNMRYRTDNFYLIIKSSSKIKYYCMFKHNGKTLTFTTKKYSLNKIIELALYEALYKDFFTEERYKDKAQYALILKDKHPWFQGSIKHEEST